MKLGAITHNMALLLGSDVDIASPKPFLGTFHLKQRETVQYFQFYHLELVNNRLRNSSILQSRYGKEIPL